MRGGHRQPQQNIHEHLEEIDETAEIVQEMEGMVKKPHLKEQKMKKHLVKDEKYTFDSGEFYKKKDLENKMVDMAKHDTERQAYEAQIKVEQSGEKKKKMPHDINGTHKQKTEFDSAEHFMKQEVLNRMKQMDDIRIEQQAKYLENHSAPQKQSKNEKQVGEIITKKNHFDSAEYYLKKSEDERMYSKLEECTKEKLRQVEIKKAQEASIMRPGAQNHQVQEFDSGTHYQQVSLAKKEIEQMKKEGVK